MLRASILNLDDLSDLEAIINIKGASEVRNYFEVYVRARGECKPLEAALVHVILLNAALSCHMHRCSS